PDREKRIIVVTDGAPTYYWNGNTCAGGGSSAPTGSVNSVINAAGAALGAGYPVFFVGFDNLGNEDEDNMDDFAQAGGTGTWYEVSSTDTTDFENAINTIASLTVSCSVQLTPQNGDDLDRMRVSIVEGMSS